MIDSWRDQFSRAFFDWRRKEACRRWAQVADQLDAPACALCGGDGCRATLVLSVPRFPSVPEVALL